MALSVLLALAWGGLAMGGVYSWAYWPLAIGSTLIGGWGLWRGRRQAAGVPFGVLPLSLLLLIATIGCQVVPLPRTVLRLVSPASESLLLAYQVDYALALDSTASASAGESEAAVVHPISVSPRATYRALALLTAFSILLIGLARGLSGADLRALAKGIALLGVLLTLLAVIQQAVGNGKVYGLIQPQNRGAWPMGPFINHNHFAGWMNLAIPVVLGFFTSRILKARTGLAPDWRRRLLWLGTQDANSIGLVGAAILTMGLGLAFSLSRSGIASLGLALTFAALQITRGEAARRRLLVIGILAAVFAIVAAGGTGLGRIFSRFSDAPSDLVNRLLAWRDAWHVFERFPRTGSGLNTFGIAMLFYQEADVNAHLAQAHNDYLQLLAEGGVLVGLPALLVIVTMANEAWCRFREQAEDPTAYWIRAGAVTGLVAIALQETLDFSLQMPGNAILFIVLGAIAVRPARGRPLSQERHFPEHRNPTVRRART